MLDNNYERAQAAYDAMEPPDADYDDDQEPEEDHEPRTWHRIDGWTQDDGSIKAYVQTNDDEDRGHPTSYAEWARRYINLEQFQRQAGYSRVGFLGCVVTVTLDGEEQHPPAEMARRARVNDLAKHLAGEIGRLLPEFEGATYGEVVAKLLTMRPPE